MMTIKNGADIQKMKAAGRVVEETLALMEKLVRPGVSTLELDRAAEDFIRSKGAYPSFLHYNGYPKSICASVNEQVVHGIPGHYRLKEGDIAPAGFHLGEEGLWIREIASEEEMPPLIAQAVQGGGSLFEARVIRPTLAEIYEAYADGRPRKAGEQHEQDGEADVSEPQAPAAPGAEGAPAAQDEAQV